MSLYPRWQPNEEGTHNLTSENSFKLNFYNFNNSVTLRKLLDISEPQMALIIRISQASGISQWDNGCERFVK